MDKDKRLYCWDGKHGGWGTSSPSQSRGRNTSAVGPQMFFFSIKWSRGQGGARWVTHMKRFIRSFSRKALPSPRSHVQDPQWDAHVRSSWNKVSSDPATQLLPEWAKSAANWTHLEECWCAVWSGLGIWNNHNYKWKWQMRLNLPLNQWKPCPCQGYPGQHFNPPESQVKLLREWLQAF